MIVCYGVYCFLVSIMKCVCVQELSTCFQLVMSRCPALLAASRVAAVSELADELRAKISIEAEMRALRDSGDSHKVRD